MLEYERRIKSAKTFFENKDVVLGYRKLMDCVIDTQDLDLYKEIISLTDWKESNQYKEDEFIEKSITILDKVAKIAIDEKLVGKSVVAVEGVTKTYGKRSFALGPVSLQINKGEIYGLVGENGNGKTTLLRVLAKELQHNSGTITYNFDENYIHDYDLRTKLVYIPQRTQKWYGSLQDNLKFVLSNYKIPAQEIETRVLMMIARFGLWNYKDLKWHELSSGYKMRFELARTMLRQPELLLLDEPLANLDVLAQQVILEDLKSMGRSLNNPVAIILSSQQLYEVEKVSDKVVFLKNGKQDVDIAKDKIVVSDNLIVEIESDDEREDMVKVLEGLGLVRLTFNGGIYFAYFTKETRFTTVLTAIGSSNLTVIYLRNITNSTRRFFVS